MENLEKHEWYREMILDCRAIITEKVFISRMELIQGYHMLGKRILEENENFEREKIYGNKIVQHVANSMGKSRRTIAYSLQFVKQFPDITLLPGGKNISWHKICSKVLQGKSLDEQCIHKEFKMMKVCKECNCRIRE